MTRRTTDLRDPGSFDHVGRDTGTNQFVTGSVLADLADRDARIVAASADLKYVTKLSDFEERHPARFFQFGISERNMFSAAAGMASCGFVPYVSTFASFAGLLAYEIVRTDFAYPNLPVRILATHCGISMGFFGTSHHATEDISAMRSIAGLRILSPCDAVSLRSLLEATVDHPGPIYFRIGRGTSGEVYGDATRDRYGDGHPVAVQRGDRVLLIATGIMVAHALAAARRLRDDMGINCTVVDVYQLKPFATADLAELAVGHELAISIEEHNVEGGLGTMVQESLAAAGLGLPVYKHGLQDEFGIIGPPTHLYRYYGLDVDGIAEIVRRALALPSGRRPSGTSTLWTATDRAAVLEDCQRRDRADWPAVPES